MKTYLTVSEVANLLETSGTSIRRWIIQGKLSAYRTGGGQYRVKREDFEKFKTSLGITNQETTDV
jgi:excisionase family DNA binding protein